MPVEESQSPSRRILMSLFAVIGQFVLAVIVSAVPGLLLDALLDSHYHNLFLDKNWPVPAIFALLLGYFLDPPVTRRIGATSVWIVGLLWLGAGIWDTSSGWSPKWSTEPSRWVYMVHSLFGKTTQCSGSECMGELVFTMPFIVSVTYSLGAFVRGYSKLLSMR